MAISKAAFQITGGIRGFSFYTIAGSDKVIVRTKGGPKKIRVKKAPEFEKLRSHQKEWFACVLFSKELRDALGETYRLADFNVSPVWNGMGKKLMNLDTEHVVGERVLKISPYRQVLENFNLNRNFPFNSVLKVSPTYEVNRESLQATVTFPRINTMNDLLNIQRLPYFRLIVSLGIISDIAYHPEYEKKKYAPTLGISYGSHVSTISNWFSALDSIDEQTLNLQMGKVFFDLLTDEVTLLLGIGIEFGNVGFAGQITEVKRSCCGKILHVC